MSTNNFQFLLKNKMLKSFEDSGLNLSPEKQEQLKLLKDELTTLSLNFNKNISNHKLNSKIILDDNLKQNLSEKELKWFDNNELKYDELGFAKRSDSKENKTPSGMAGQYIVSFEGMELIIAPGHFKHHERVEHLRNKAEYIGRMLKFRYFNKGVKDLPRFPRAIGFRSKIDV